MKRKLIMMILCMMLIALSVVGCGVKSAVEWNNSESSEIDSEGENVYMDGYLCLYEYDCRIGYLKHAYQYNEKGLLEKESAYDSMGEVTDEMQIAYDKNGKIIEIISKSCKMNVETTGRITYSYDEKGEQNVIRRNYAYDLDKGYIDFKISPNGPVSAVQFNEDGTVRATATYEYDSHKNVVFAQQVQNQNGEEEAEEYTFERNYDEFGRIIIEVGYESGLFSYKKGFEYDKNGNKVKEINYKEDGTISSYYVYAYDEKNNLVEDITYKKDGSVVSTIYYEYDENDNRILKEVNRSSDSLGGAGYWWENYQYDDMGNMIRVVTHSEDAWNSVKEYEYDEAGNVIRFISYGKDGYKVTDEYYKWVLLSDYQANKSVYEREIQKVLGGETGISAHDNSRGVEILDDKTIDECAKRYYGGFLNYYKTYAECGFEGFYEMINGIYCTYGFEGELYYTIIDLANDGIPELFISDGEMIYDAYAIYQVSAHEQQIVPLVSYSGAYLGDRLQCEICEGNILKISSSGGYDSGEIAYWKLNIEEHDLTLVEGVYGNGQNYYYGTVEKEEYGVPGYENQVVVSKEDYWNMDKKYSIVKNLNWRKLSGVEWE